MFPQSLAHQCGTVAFRPARGPIGGLQKLFLEDNLYGFHMWSLLHSLVHKIQLRRSTYAHFFPNASRFERPRSSGVMATRNSTFALKVRNQGSARAGMPEGSSRFTTRVPPRCPSCSQK